MDEIVRTIETKSGPINIRKDKDGNEYGWVPENELEIVEEQTFFNNGQFTENELDLINWGLNDLLQEVNKYKNTFQGGGLELTVATCTKQINQLENLIEKIQEGS